MQPKVQLFSKNRGTAMPTSSLLTNPLTLASHTPSMASQLYAMSSYTFIFYISYHCSQSTSEEAARDIAAFVAIFFENFPSFKRRAFHMAGESYGVSAYLLCVYWLLAEGPACRDGISLSLPLRSMTRTPCSLERT